MPERLDRESILVHIDHLQQAMTELRRKVPSRPKPSHPQPSCSGSLPTGFDIATQNVVDIATQIVVALSGQAPDDYRSALEDLGRLHVLDEGFANRIAPMAGLRNILVHGYLRLDAARLAAALAELDDLTTIASAVLAFLGANPGL